MKNTHAIHFGVGIFFYSASRYTAAAISSHSRCSLLSVWITRSSSSRIAPRPSCVCRAPCSILIPSYVKIFLAFL